MKKIILGLASLVLVFGLMGNVGAIGTTLYVNDDDATCGGNSPCYGTIQEAIDNANDGDTIEVAAGTYEEQLIIDVSITLQGEDRETTIIEYPTAPVSDQYLVMVQADDVTITGFKLLGHFATGNRAAYIVHSQGAGLIVEDNEIQGHIGVFGNLINGQIKNNIIGTNRKGIYIPGGNVLNLLIEGNTIEPAESAGSYASNCGAIYMDHANYVTIQGNTMQDFSSSTDSSMTDGRGVEGSNNSFIAILDNTFENSRDAITMWIVTDIEIDGNTIANSDRYGINIKGQNINIMNNEITGSGDSGVHIAKWVIPTQNVNVNFNNIVGNTNYGVKNGWSGEVNAEYNWWGHASGPSGPDGRTSEKGKVIGRGDAVSANVDWNPWLPQPVGHTPQHLVPPGIPKHNSLPENAEEVALRANLPEDELTKIVFIRYASGFAVDKPCDNDGVCDSDERGWCADCKDKNEDSSTACYDFLANSKPRWNWIEDYYYSTEELRVASGSATSKWNDASSATIFGTGIFDEDCPWGVYDYKNAMSFGNYPDENVIAVAGIWFRGKTIYEYDIMFDIDFFPSDDTGTVDLGTVALHEFGHAAGLGDLYDPVCISEVMYGIYEGEKLDLGDSDISGIQELYGN